MKKTLYQHIFSFLMGDLVSPFYFITIIFQFYVLFGIILYIFKKFNNNLILLVVGIASILYFKFIYFEYSDRFFGTYLIYFIIGCYSAFNIDKFRRNVEGNSIIIIPLYFSFSFYFIKSVYISNVYGRAFSFWRFKECLFSIISIIIFYYISYYFSKRFGNKIMKVFKIIDGASYYIYLSHCIIIYICSEVWHLMGINSITGEFVFTTLLLFPIIFAGCIFYSSFIKKHLISKLNTVKKH